MLELNIGRSGKGDARREVDAPDLLGRSNSDNRLHIELDICLRDKAVTVQTVFRAEAELGTPLGV